MARRFYVLGALLLLAGILGFVVATPMFGVLPVNSILNALHVMAGMATIAVATRGIGTMRMWGQLLGLLFAGLTVAGFVGDGVELLSLTSSSAWLHLVVALFFLYHAWLAPPTV